MHMPWKADGVTALCHAIDTPFARWTTRLPRSGFVLPARRRTPLYNEARAHANIRQPRSPRRLYIIIPELATAAVPPRVQTPFMLCKSPQHQQDKPNGSGADSAPSSTSRQRRFHRRDVQSVRDTSHSPQYHLEFVKLRRSNIWISSRIDCARTTPSRNSSKSSCSRQSELRKLSSVRAFTSSTDMCFHFSSNVYANRMRCSPSMFHPQKGPMVPTFTIFVTVGLQPSESTMKTPSYPSRISAALLPRVR